MDFSATHNICHAEPGPDDATACMVQLLADGSTWTTIYTTSGGNGGVDDLPGLAGAGRYVRIMSTADDSLAGYGLYEFEVYGA